MDEHEERRILGRLLDGETEAYALLVKRYQGPIYNLMLRMTRPAGLSEDAMDLAQETFIKAYDKLDGFRPGARFFPWLYSIGMNVARDHLRARKAHRHQNLDDIPLEAPDQDQERMLLDKLDHEALRQALERLPDDYRECLVLRYRHECSVKELSQALKISESGVKMRLSRGLDKLRSLLRPGEQA